MESACLQREVRRAGGFPVRVTSLLAVCLLAVCILVVCLLAVCLLGSRFPVANLCPKLPISAHSVGSGPPRRGGEDGGEEGEEGGQGGKAGCGRGILRQDSLQDIQRVLNRNLIFPTCHPLSHTPSQRPLGQAIQDLKPRLPHSPSLHRILLVEQGGHWGASGEVEEPECLKAERWMMVGHA
eukprot:CAMPEP_0114131304 /NCGR_PEP_ID=MMETSP0043_2-20121206/12478_1 /TAXON_ID=464988 /ORGANISM="Hemiselmis andersenii, Strain CCMP644" /LENGTH=181 /DNA_ID=CAMNT_0001224719 /DNA_START=238 /DNA_END=782 /DNA_ORIENTATION=+